MTEKKIEKQITDAIADIVDGMKSSIKEGMIVEHQTTIMKHIKKISTVLYDWQQMNI